MRTYLLGPTADCWPLYCPTRRRAPRSSRGADRAMCWIGLGSGARSPRPGAGRPPAGPWPARCLCGSTWASPARSRPSWGRVGRCAVAALRLFKFSSPAQKESKPIGELRDQLFPKKSENI